MKLHKLQNWIHMAEHKGRVMPELCVLDNEVTRCSYCKSCAKVQADSMKWLQQPQRQVCEAQLKVKEQARDPVMHACLLD